MSSHNPVYGETTSACTARNIIAKHGEAGLRRLLDGFITGNHRLHHAFGVSRERVSQWRRILGVATEVYVAHPDIQAIANEGS